jgi:pyruvate, water dikinase
MTEAARSQRTGAQILAALQERAKELNCLYEVEEILKRDELSLDEMLQRLVAVIPPGWQHPDVCHATITHDGRVFKSGNFAATPWVLRSDINVQGRRVGELAVYYTEERPAADLGPFLDEESRLANTIAERLGYHLLFLRLREMHQGLSAEGDGQTAAERGEWRAPIRLLRQSDEILYLRIARKMLNHLFSIGAAEARTFLHEVEADAAAAAQERVQGEVNVPGQRRAIASATLMTDRLFEVAALYHSDQEILDLVQKWMLQDKASFFGKVLDNPRSSLNEIADALRRFSQTIASSTELAPSTRRSFRVALSRRFLTEQLEFNKLAKDYIRIADFVGLLDRLILLPASYGRLGGKAAGLMLAQHVLEYTRTPDRPIGEIKVPRTWYIASNGLLDFVAYNDLDDVIEQKWKEIDQVRQEYPNIVQLFKNSQFPPEVVHGVSSLLDEAGDVPLIVRSSSLLEDRLGTAFSGKYKSLFVANQGDKSERLEALLDAIAEVYASTFSPDPIEYRRERNLLEFYEEMGILIQEVVGTRVGKYYLPAFAGVAFSNNEFRWSPRIRREDGLVRLVPGLGTRAVDRVPDDYPVLLAPGQPTLKVNVDTREVVRYSPSKADVINLETRTIETVAVRDILRACGGAYPGLENVFSIYRGDMLQRPVRMLFDPERDDAVVTFQGLFDNTPFVQQMTNILAVLQEHMETAVDIEFAHTGTDFYLLQCRPQSYTDDVTPAPIPKDVPLADYVFTANRYVSNGWVPAVTHIVYVDPAAYGALPDQSDLHNVARAVGALNKLLPKRRFILMGPGRWGSREVTLGVPVTYADINNTAMLVEIARKKGQYLPDVSFGTHFFQDLVESRIRYLPLYPDEEGVIFNESFLRRAPNLLAEMVPEYAYLAEVVRVIDVPASAGGRHLKVLMNAELGEAVAVFGIGEDTSSEKRRSATGTRQEPAQFWLWREQMAERIALETDAERFGVVAMYVFGSTKNATAGPGSDIDMLVHFRGSPEQRRDLVHWLEGWSLCLAEMNYLRTGYRTHGLLDVHIVTDDDIARRTSFASKIGAITDPARPLEMHDQTPQVAPERPRTQVRI